MIIFRFIVHEYWALRWRIWHRFGGPRPTGYPFDFEVMRHPVVWVDFRYVGGAA